METQTKGSRGSLCKIVSPENGKPPGVHVRFAYTSLQNSVIYY